METGADSTEEIASTLAVFELWRRFPPQTFKSTNKYLVHSHHFGL